MAERDPTRGEILSRVRGLCRYDEQRLGYVYFISGGFGHVTYVGQTLNLRTRIRKHRQEGVKQGAMVYAIRVPVQHLDGVEKIFIRMLTPEHNQCGGCWSEADLNYVIGTHFQGDGDFVRRALRELPDEGLSSDAVRFGTLDVPHIDDLRFRGDVSNTKRMRVRNEVFGMLCAAQRSANNRAKEQSRGQRRRRKSPSPSPAPIGGAK